MDMMPVENSTEVPLSSDVMDHHTEDLNPQLLNHGDEETKSEITEEEVRGILDVIAATGKFWHDWDTLKTLLSFRLKQVMAEYPEAQMVTDQQTAALGETHAELVKRLDEALLSFIEGPPFTLQRLCEILLAARSIYPNLSKLALALEKNLLVTSTLIVSTDPYPPTIMPKPDEHEKGSVVSSTPSAPLQNGVEVVVVDQDEEMTDAEEIDEDKVVEDSKGSDKVIMEETINGTSETSLDQSINAEPSSDQSINVEPSSDQNINAEPSPKQSNNAEPSSDHSNNSEPSANPSNNSEPSGESSLSSEQLDSASQ